MTLNINEYYGVTVNQGEKRGPKLWLAEAQAFRRDSMNNVGPVFHGNGTTRSTSNDDALRQARSFVRDLPPPSDWQKPLN